MSLYELFAVFVVIVGIGVTYGDARARIGRIERRLGNGHGDFMIREVIEERLSQVEYRLDRIENP